MKKAFYPGMAGLGRMRPAKDVSSRAFDQSTWQGLMSFDGHGSGGDTIFAIRDKPKESVAREVDYRKVEYNGHGESRS
jgi:hypothetical protein